MRFLALTLLLALLLARVPAAHATELYASETGKPCSFCHVDPAGGGELTPQGKAFAAQRHGHTREHNVEILNKGIRFVAGYLHLLTAILWFGTILYVHLVLKPAYASGGLPRGEVRVGLMSMAVMAVTGAVLTYYRIPSWDLLLHTRFGVLLLAKIGVYLVMVLSALFVVIFLGPKLKARHGGKTPAEGDLNGEELAACDGKEGRPVYFGFEGKVYDASASKLWRGGTHVGRHHAGMDLTEALNDAPHGPDKVAALRQVGKLLPAGKAPLHERVFYVMAYMNLSAVFLIVLIVTLWKWAP
jgi:predicted heme/steroid binding protein/uncharacterized membrane protein